VTTPAEVVGVGVAAGVGAPARYLLDRWVATRWERVFPWGTFVVNVAGCLLLGLTIGLVRHDGLSHSWALVLGTGFAGSFTTFSTWILESARLAEDGSLTEAGLNLAGSLAAGLLAAGVGLLLAGGG